MTGAVLTEPSDESLVLAARSGSTQALDELADRHFGLVYAIGLARLNDRDEAEDLAQEVFLRVCLLLDRLQEPALFSHWISRITRNLAIDWQRRGDRASRLLPMIPIDDVSEELVNSGAPTPRDEASAAEHVSALRQTLARLRPDERELLLLHYMEGLSHSDIAERLGVDRSTVSRHIARSLSRMQGLFDQVLRQAVSRLRPRTTLRARILTVTAAAVALPPAGKTAMAAQAATVLGQGALAGISAGSASASVSPGVMSFARAAHLLFKTGGIAVSIGKAASVVAVAAIAVAGYFVLHEGNVDPKQPPSPVAAESRRSTPETQVGMVISGRSMGPVKLGMSKDELLACLGKPDQEEAGTYKYFKLGLEVFASTKKGVIAIYAHAETPKAERRGFNDYGAFQGQTDRGIKVGADRQAVGAAYGVPEKSATLGPEENWVFVRDGVSLTFTFRKDGSLRCIGITQK